MITTKNRACGSKTRHDTRGAAQTHRRRLINRGANPDSLTVYECRHCAGYHVGHLPKRKRRR